MSGTKYIGLSVNRGEKIPWKIIYVTAYKEGNHLGGWQMTEWFRAVDFPYYYLDLFSVVPSSAQRPRCGKSQPTTSWDS